MFDTKKCILKNYKFPLIFVGGFLFIVSVMTFAFSTITYNSTVGAKGFIETEARITRIYYDSYDETHDVYVEFYVEGVSYSGRLNYYSSSMSVGGWTDIKYNPNNPSDFIADEQLSFVFCIVFSIIFVINFTIFIILIYKHFKNKIHLNSLREKGNKRSLVISYFDYNTSTTVNGKTMFFLACEDEFNNVCYLSNKIFLKEYKFTIGDKINVYLDPNNKYVFFVDHISYLKEKSSKYI